MGLACFGFIKPFVKANPNELYELYVRPHLDYGDVIYHIPQKVNDFSHEVTLHPLMERLASVLNSAGLAITGAWNRHLKKQNIRGAWLGIFE